MHVRWKARLRFMIWCSVVAFAIPIGFMLAIFSGHLTVKEALLSGTVNAVLAGPTLTFLFFILFPYTRRYSFLPAILTQVVSFLVAGALIIAVNVGVMVAVWDGRPPFDPLVLDDSREILMSSTMQWVFYAAIAMFFGFCSFQQINRKLGPGVLWQWVTGKYHRPREEEWVFMFLDIKDSTPLAERLGSLQYSVLVQEFFNDLGWALWSTKGKISHYIGDEAVIVWRPKDAFREANCIRLFHRMREEMSGRTQFYKERFGVVPSFKAGVHVGTVVAAEVGRAKSEVVYHGDAVNTTARIVGMCSTLGHDLLVSREIVDRLADPALGFESLGPHELKGKKKPVELFAVASPSA